MTTRSLASLYEGWVFRAFQMDPETWLRDRRWVREFLALSDLILGVEATGGSTGSSGEGPDTFLRALVYGQRTFLWMHRWAGWPPPGLPGPLWDMGGGLGSASLAWAHAGGGSAVVVDHACYGEAGAKIWAEAGQRAQFRPGDLRDGVAGLRSVWALSLREAFPDAGQAAAHLSNWWRPGAWGVVLEPGTERSGRWIQELRDEVRERVPVAGPCGARGSCPRRNSVRDWCHFTWNVGLGPQATRLLQMAGRSSRPLHASVLVLGEPSNEPGERLLEIRRKGKELWLHTCAAEGERKVRVQKRDKGLWKRIQDLSPGARIDWNGPELVVLAE